MLGIRCWGEYGRVVELWLVRHGETEWSAEGRHTEPDRSSADRARAATGSGAGEVSGGDEVCGGAVQPMQRARETCEIAGFGAQAVVDDGLSEWDYGVYEGRTTQEIQTEIPGWNVWKDPIVGGETVEQVGARADGVIARALVAAGGPTSQNRDCGAPGYGGGCRQWGGEGGAVCSCAYSADIGGAVGGAGGAGRGTVGAGDGEPERVGMGAGDEGDYAVESRV